MPKEFEEVHWMFQDHLEDDNNCADYKSKGAHEEHHKIEVVFLSDAVVDPGAVVVEV